jgi:hypothetical protein
MNQQAHMRAQIFLFLLRMALFVSIGVVLHNAQSTSVISDCPGLWESMLAILVIKCVRMTICSTVVKMLNTGVTQELKHRLRVDMQHLLLQTCRCQTCAPTSHAE